MVIAFTLPQALPDMLAMSMNAASDFGALLADATEMPAVAVPSPATIDSAAASEPAVAPLDPSAIVPLAAFLPRIAPVASTADPSVEAPDESPKADETPLTPAADCPVPIETLLAALLPTRTSLASVPTPVRSTPSPARPTATREVAAVATSIGHLPLASDAPTPQPAAAPFTLVQPATPSASAPLNTLPEPRLDLSRDTAWIDTLARDIAAIGSAGGKLRFALRPEALGRMEVDVRHSADGLHVRVTTQSEPARTIIADAQPRLTEDLRAQGVRVAETQVSAEADRHAARQQAAPRAVIEAATDPLPFRETAVARDGRFA